MVYDPLQRMRSTNRVPAVAALLLACGASACGPGAEDLRPRIVSAGGFPVRIEGGLSGTVEIRSRPTRVLPGNAAFVDFVSALLEPSRVAALPRAAEEYSRLLETDADWNGVPRFEGFTGELVLALEPDLVLVHPWQGPEALAQVRARGVPVLVLPLPRQWQDVLDTLRLLGNVLGEEERAAALLAELEGRRLDLQRSRCFSGGFSALSYSNLGTSGTTAGRETTADILFELAGLRNAAGDAGLVGHAMLDLEGLLALDPDWIIVGDLEFSAGPAPAKAYLLSQESLQHLDAVREERIIELSPRFFSSASFELLAAAETLVAEIERISTPRSPH